MNYEFFDQVDHLLFKKSWSKRSEKVQDFSFWNWLLDLAIKLYFYMYLYWWSKCAFSILLSLARRFWNQILICVSVRSRASASSNLLGLDMYSFLWYSSSNLQTRKNCITGNCVSGNCGSGNWVKSHLISEQICEDIDFPKLQRKYC